MRRALLFLFGGLILAQRLVASDPTADATAKFLAGLPLRGTPLEARSAQPAWTKHVAEMDRAWSRLEQEQLSKIRNWAPESLEACYNDSSPLFYMFSGPDFLYANAFFPNAQAYILCGIEPVGAIPDIESISSAALPATLTNLRKSLDSVLSWSFFITKQMKTDLKHTRLNGTLPILYVFLARANATIQSVSLFSLDSDGNVIEAGKGNTPGVKIDFTSSGGTEQTLYYFSTNLSNDAIKKAPGFMKFCEKQPPGLSLVKAATYLMHRNWFSTVRNFLLTNSKIILQDDSGIPVRFFDEKNWDLRFFGSYARPIPMFNRFWQADLAKMYAKSAPAPPLGFGFGYRWRREHSGLMVAIQK